MMNRETIGNMQSYIPKIKFEKLVHLVGFIIRIYHDARFSECQIPPTPSAGIKGASDTEKCCFVFLVQM